MSDQHPPVTPTSLGYFVIGASDLAAWRHFAVHVVGMMAGDIGETLALRLDENAQRLLVEADDHDDLNAVGWCYDSERELDAAIDQARRLGATVEDGSATLCATRHVERLARLADPNGLVHELHYGPAMAPMDQAFRSAVLRGGFVAGQLGAGHYVAIADDRAATERFYRKVLGLRLSDYIRGEVAPGGPVLEATFLHAASGRHHSVAFACAPAAKRIHHIMVEVADMNDVGLARDRCRAGGVPLMMDLGHHPNDGMFSFYCVTPGGFGLEIGAGGRVIDEDAWAVRSYTRLSDWGHQPPPG
ncbi:MAG: VOC family protein [Gammaproteobacteria bacterium]|nr:VOC family protein [Gammaproteobacteria bacterium]MCP5200260.1 VOC family protein [Gammaproteobacteria bacterium]